MGGLVHEVTEKITTTNSYALKASDSSTNVLCSINDLEKSMKITLGKMSLLQHH